MSADILLALGRLNLVGSLAILTLLLLRRLLRGAFGAQIAYLAWLCVPLALVANLLPAPAQPIVEFAEASIVAAVVPALGQAATGRDLAPWLLFVWLTGVAATAFTFGLQQRRYRRGLGRLMPREGGHVLQSDSIFAGPALLGAWRARVVLPLDFEQRYDPRERELILAHEESHRRRGDAWVNAGLALLQSLNWFNPLLHYGVARFRLDQELACDAAVLERFPEARRPYADAMLKVQLAGRPRQEPRLPVGCRWPSGRTLKERILMLKHPLPDARRRAGGFALITLLMFAASAVAWASQAPRSSLALAQTGSAPTAQGAVADASQPSYRALRPPVYPAEMIADRTQGTVVLRVLVGVDGVVQKAELESTRPALLDAALVDSAIRAVRDWTFNPARSNGQAVEAWVVVPIQFELPGGPQAEEEPVGPGALDTIRVSGKPAS